MGRAVAELTMGLLDVAIIISGIILAAWLVDSRRSGGS
jgi:hypothetical protein